MFKFPPNTKLQANKHPIQIHNHCFPPSNCQNDKKFEQFANPSRILKQKLPSTVR